MAKKFLYPQNGNKILASCFRRHADSSAAKVFHQYALRSHFICSTDKKRWNELFFLFIFAGLSVLCGDRVNRLKCIIQM